MGTAQKRLIAISGPSCGGKGPLLAAVAQFCPDQEFAACSVVKSRESRSGQPRPDELAIWDNPDFFRSRAEIEALTGDRYLRAVSHGYPQVLDLERIVRAPSPLVVLEACQQITRQLPGSDYLRGIQVTTLFLSPLGGEEIARLRACRVDAAEFLKGLGVCRLLARAAFHGRRVDEAFLADVAVRAGDAVDELRTAHLFDYVLAGRAGEGAAEWNRDPQGRFLGPPRGEAAATLETFRRLLAGVAAPGLEHWPVSPL